MAWTEERTALARRLWEEGHSASLIADRLGDGVTRNSVIGKAHRGGWGQRRPAYARPGTPRGWMRLSEPDPEPKAKPRRARVKPDETPARSHAPRAAPPPPPPPSPHQVDPTIEPPSRDLRLIELAADQCKWPYGDGPFVFCGHPVPEGVRNYCPHHFLRGTSGSSARQFRPGDWR